MLERFTKRHSAGNTFRASSSSRKRVNLECLSAAKLKAFRDKFGTTEERKTR
jgi:hypothetical protein